MSQRIPQSSSQLVYWRVEGSLLELTAVRPVAFFAWNAQTFTERWFRRSSILLTAALRPLLYMLDRSFATRVVYAVLRGISLDRLDLKPGIFHCGGLSFLFECDAKVLGLFGFSL